MRPSIEIFISAVCNLNCKYCYIPKSKSMLTIQKKLPQLLDRLSDIPEKSKVEYLGFWGAEPTLSERLILQCVGKAVETFPNLKQISFSTNGTRLSPLLNIVNAALEKNIDVDVQFSLDGPEYINGMNRAPGILKTVEANILAFISKMNDKKFGKNLTISFKPTLTIENMRFLLENNLIPDVIEYFKNLETKTKKEIRNKNIHFKPSCLYTLEVPGRYTKEDGLLFGEFLKELHKFGSSVYSFRFFRIIDLYPALGRKPCMFSCSGGDSNIGFDHKGHVHICHRTFMLNEPTYLNEILRMPEYKNWDVSLLRRDAIDSLNQYFIIPIKDNERITRMSYATRCYHDFWRIRMSTCVSLINELAYANQISPIYKNQDIAAILALFLHTAFSCPMENILNTSSIHVMPTSLIRLWGNGAFRELIREVLQRTR